MRDQNSPIVERDEKTHCVRRRKKNGLAVCKKTLGELRSSLVEDKADLAWRSSASLVARWGPAPRADSCLSVKVYRRRSSPLTIATHKQRAAVSSSSLRRSRSCDTRSSDDPGTLIGWVRRFAVLANEARLRPFEAYREDAALLRSRAKRFAISR